MNGKADRPLMEEPMAMDPDSDEARAGRLIRRLAAEDPQVRLKAAAALGRLQGVVGEAVEPLTASLKDADAHVRKMAALALGDIGPEARSAVPALIEALRDAHEGVRRRAAVALGEIAGPEALPALRAALTDASPAVRRAAQLAVQAIDPAPSAEAA
jgi:HEAT repeat protein